MQTVQLQCGNCRQLMAISVEHLGGQVQCPHCRTIVQTPPPKAPPTPPPPPPLPPEPEPEPVIEVADLEPPESIFSAPESQDVVGESPTPPKVEMPEEDEEEPPVEIVEGPPPKSKRATDDEEEAPEPELPKFKPRPVYTATILPIIALIFLVPYAAVMTAFVIYLLFYGSSRAPHPLDMLVDPVPDKGKGGPRQVSRIIPTTKLDKHQFVSIGKTIQIGDIAVTPQRVQWTEEGDLKLELRAKNISTSTAFDPIHEVFVRYDFARPGTEPYTFLETKSHNFFGAFLAYHKDGNTQEQDESLDSVVLRPHQETTIYLKTYKEHRDKLAKVASANESVVWRVQVRRGFVKHKGKDISTTAVIGVEFPMPQFERGRKDT